MIDLNEFSKKIISLRKDRGLTQEQLAEKLCISRVAVSKWENGRGFPNIDSLKMMADVFEVSVDELISSGEIIELARIESGVSKNILSIVFGGIDFLAFTFFFLPVFADRYTSEDYIYSISLFKLIQFINLANILIIILYVASIFLGAFELAFQNHYGIKFKKRTFTISFIINIILTGILCVTAQPYACMLSLFALIFKAYAFYKIIIKEKL